MANMSEGSGAGLRRARRIRSIKKRAIPIPSRAPIMPPLRTAIPVNEIGLRTVQPMDREIVPAPVSAVPIPERPIPSPTPLGVTPLPGYGVQEALRQELAKQAAARAAAQALLQRILGARFGY